MTIRDTNLQGDHLAKAKVNSCVVFSLVHSSRGSHTTRVPPTSSKLSYPPRTRRQEVLPKDTVVLPPTAFTARKEASYWSIRMQVANPVCGEARRIPSPRVSPAAPPWLSRSDADHDHRERGERERERGKRDQALIIQGIYKAADALHWSHQLRCRKPVSHPPPLPVTLPPL